MHFLSCYCSTFSSIVTLAVLAAATPHTMGSSTEITADLATANKTLIASSSSAANLTFSWRPLCYSPMDTPSAPATLEMDCILGAYEILLASQADVPVDWQVVRPATSKYIARRIHGTCAVTFGALYPTSRELFPMMLVARQAALIISNCVRKKTGWRGGRSQLGPNGEHWVQVAWRDALSAENQTSAADTTTA